MFEHGLHAFFWAIRVLCSTAGSSEPRLTPRGGRVSAAAADDPDVDAISPTGPSTAARKSTAMTAKSSSTISVTGRLSSRCASTRTWRSSPVRQTSTRIGSEPVRCMTRAAALAIMSRRAVIADVAGRAAGNASVALGAPLSAVALEIGIARTHSRRQRSVSIQ